MEINTSILFIGEICSGKTTLAKKVALYTGYKYLSFGTFLKNQFGYDIDRVKLQDQGENWVNHNPSDFLRSMLQSQGNPKAVVFDGVRHKIILDQIKRMSGLTLTIFIDADYLTRLRRYIDRSRLGDETDKNSFDKISSHRVEQEIITLQDFSDIVMSSSSDAESDFSVLRQKIDSFLISNTLR